MAIGQLYDYGRFTEPVARCCCQPVPRGSRAAFNRRLPVRNLARGFRFPQTTPADASSSTILPILQKTAAAHRRQAPTAWWSRDPLRFEPRTQLFRQ